MVNVIRFVQFDWIVMLLEKLHSNLFRGHEMWLGGAAFPSLFLSSGVSTHHACWVALLVWRRVNVIASFLFSQCITTCQLSHQVEATEQEFTLNSHLTYPFSLQDIPQGLHTTQHLPVRTTRTICNKTCFRSTTWPPPSVVGAAEPTRAISSPIGPNREVTPRVLGKCPSLSLMFPEMRVRLSSPPPLEGGYN